MSSKKSISINPNFFKIGGRAKKEKKKKTKPKNSIKPNDIKKKLIAKIKAHQKKERDREIREKNQDTVFKNEFQETLSYLEEVTKKKNERKKKKRERKRNNKTMKQRNLEKGHQSQSNVQIDIGPMNKEKISNIPSAPPYGCLKGGNKPTWRQYNKTLKKNKQDITDEYKVKPPLFNLNSQFDERAEKLDKLKTKFKEMNEPSKPKKTKIKTKRIRRKITLGKNTKMGLVGVLVKSKKTRKNVKREVDVLRKKSIQEVKEYLRKHNLTKIGSNAPDHILRTTYENAYLSGDIRNKNADILLHNWHKEE